MPKKASWGEAGMNEAQLEQAGVGNYTVTAHFQIISMILVILSFAGMFIYSKKFVRIKDPYENILPLTPQKRLDFGGRPAELQLGFLLRGFPFFDMTKGTFSVNVALYFVFDPRLMSVDRVSEFFFKRGVILSKSDPVIKISGNKLFVQYELRLKFDVSLNYEDFPFDGHRVNFVVYHPNISPGEVYYTAVRNDFLINRNIEIPGWNIVDRRVVTGFEEERLVIVDRANPIVSYHPSAVFTVDFDRLGARQIMTIFIPLLLIFFISLLSFSLNPFSGARTTMLSLAAASITALISYRFVIENMSPSVGYLLIVDRMFLVFLILCGMVFLVTIFGARITRFYKSLIAAGLQSIVVAAFGYFFFWI